MKILCEAIRDRGLSTRGFGTLWVVAELVAPRTTGETFAPDDPDYNPDDRAMQQVHCRI